MNLDERISAVTQEIQTVEGGVRRIDEQILGLQQQRQALAVSYNEAQGKLKLLNELKLEEAAAST